MRTLFIPKLHELKVESPCSSSLGNHYDWNRRSFDPPVLLWLSHQDVLEAEERQGRQEGTQGSSRLEERATAWQLYEGEGGGLVTDACVVELSLRWQAPFCA